MTMLQGIAQKGPFRDLSVRVTQLNEQLQPVRDISGVQVEPNGAYRVQVAVGSIVRISVTGTFVDELSGEVVALSDPLTGVLRVGAGQRFNVNVVTHLIDRYLVGTTTGLRKNFNQNMRNAEQSMGAVLGFGPQDDLHTLDMRAIPPNAGLENPHLRLLLISGGVMSLDRNPGAMSPAWSGLGRSLERPQDTLGPLRDFAIFSGLEVVELIEQMRQTGVYSVPDLDIQGRPEWNCLTQCTFVELPESGLSIVGGGHFEPYGQATVIVRRSGDLSEAVEATVTTIAHGDALPGIDYVPIVETVRFAANVSTQRVRVPLLIDAVDEVDETFSVVLSSTARVNTEQATVRIVDEEPPGLRRPSADASTFVTGLCFVAAGAAERLDPGAQACVDPVPDLYGLVGSDAEIAMRIGVGVHGSCTDSAAASCSVQGRDWAIDLELLAMASPSGPAQVRASLGTYAYFGADVAANRDTLLDPPRFLTSLAAPDVQQVIRFARDNDLILVLRGTLNASNYAVATQQQAPVLVPLSGRINFGDRELLMVPGTVALDRNPTACSAGDLAVSAKLSTLSEDGSGVAIDPATLTPVQGANAIVAEACIELLPGNGPVDSLVTRADVDIRGAVFTLPSGQGTALAPVLPGTAVERVLLVGTPQAPTEYASTQLPFTLLINGGRLTETGLSIDVIGLQNQQLRATAPQDSRGKAALLAANDAVYRNSQSTQLAVPQSGPEGTLSILAGSAELAYPGGSLSWEDFIVQVSAGELGSVSEMTVEYQLSQNADCAVAGCPVGASVGYAARGVMQQDGKGRLLGRLQTFEASKPGFGQKQSGRLAFSRPDDLPVGATVTLAVPGFLHTANQPVAASLPGHLQNDAGAIVTHATRSQAYRLGNHAPAGLSVGPDIYADAHGQPVAAGGRDWLQEGKPPVEIDSGGGVVRLATAPATKYVLRPGGWTGVFNADPSALANGLSFSGYELFLSRFAFRAVDNTLDPLTWIDGNFALPGDAQLANIAFSGLQLDCAASLRDGHVVSESCDGGDTNGNGLIDENCPVPLGSWAMTTRVQSLRFSGPGGEPPLGCSDESQFATLGQSLAPLAFTRPLSLENGWAPAGTLAFTATRGLQQGRLDATQNSDGFPVAPSAAKLACARTNAADPVSACANGYGWVEGETLVGLPFWESLEAGFRWANRAGGVSGNGPLEADVTALLPPSYLRGLASSAASNTSLMEDLVDTPAAHFPVAYEWGNTGFGFELPAYYQPLSAGPEATPTFIGVETAGRDLIVLEASAGINYIEPERTRFSFGASADIQQFQEFSFQLNLQDPRAAERVDATLIRFGVIQRPLLTPVFERIRAPLELYNDLAGRGLDEAIEKALIVGLERGGSRAAAFSPYGEDPLVTLAKALAQINTLPEQIIALVRSEVSQPLHAQIDRLEGDVREQGRAFLTDLSARAADTVAGTQPIPLDLLDRIETLASSMDDIVTQASAINARALDVEDQGKALLGDAQAAVQRIQQVVPAVETRLRQITAFSSALCGTTLSGELDSFLNQLFEQLGGLRLALDIAGNTDLLLPLIQLAAQDPELNRALQEGQAGVRRAALELQGRLLIIEGRLKDAVCRGDAGEILQQAFDFLTDLSDLAAIADQTLLAAEAELDRLERLQQQAVALLVKPMTTVAAEVRKLADTARDAATPPTAEQLSDAFDALQARVVQQDNLALLLPDPTGPDAVNVLLAPTGRSDDLLGYVARELRGETDEVVNNLELALRRLVDDNLPRLSYTPDELRQLLVGLLMDTDTIRTVRAEADAQLTELRYRVNELVTQITDQVNLTVQGALARVENRINQVLEKASAPLKAIPLQSAGLDGFAVIAGKELERVHIGAEWLLSPGSDGEEPRKFGAALDAASWSANNKTAGCSIPEGESRLDVTLSAFNLPAAFGPSKVVMKEISMGFTLDQQAGKLAPKGVFGGLFVQGDIGMSEFVVYDPALMAGIGDLETYFGARAGLLVSTIAVEGAFLAGKTCNQDVLLKLDPKVAQFIPIPDVGFAGAYLRGSASIPVYSNGCPLTLGVAADAGAWVLAGPPLTVGGLIGGGAFGKVGCVGALRGQLRALGTVNTDGDYVFAGEGFGVAGAGLCEPAGWTSVERSREDTLCGTADARIAASFDGSWSLLDLSVSALH